jgi:hypothetical protein
LADKIVDKGFSQVIAWGTVCTTDLITIYDIELL